MKQIKGVLSSLTIDGDELTVSKLTKVTFLKSDITSIDFQEASMAANGYIKFKLSNGNTPSVNFNVFQQTDFSKLLSELKDESKPQNSNEYDSESGLNESLYNLAKDIVNEYGNNKLTCYEKFRTISGLGIEEAMKYIDTLLNTDSAQSSIEVNTFEAAKLPVKPEHKSKKQIVKERIAENKEKGIVCCPKCGSTSLSSNKKGFGIGKAIVGACISNNPIGLVTGNIGAKKVRITCMNCGHEFWAGKIK